MTPVVRRVFGEAVDSVGGDQGGVVTDPGEAFPRQVHQCGFDVDGEYVLIAEPVAQ